MMFIQRLKTCSSAFQLPTHAPRAWNLLYKSPARGRNLLLAVVAVGVRAAAVAVVDEAGGGHPEGLQDARASAEQKGLAVRVAHARDDGRTLSTAANGTDALGI